MRKIILGILIAVVIGIVYFNFNPGNNAIFPKCPFLIITKWECPGCGSQRALHSLLHFNFKDAFKYNALLVLSIPIVAILLYAEFNRKKYPAFYSKLHNIKFIWGYFTIVIFWFIFRNIFHI